MVIFFLVSAHFSTLNVFILECVCAIFQVDLVENSLKWGFRYGLAHVYVLKQRVNGVTFW